MKLELLMWVVKFFVKYFRSIFMSRVGQSIINIPSGVEVKKVDNMFLVKGSKGELSAPLDEIVDVIINEKEIKVELKDNNAKNKALWGTTRALINNAVQGVSVVLKKKWKLLVWVTEEHFKEKN